MSSVVVHGMQQPDNALRHFVMGGQTCQRIELMVSVWFVSPVLWPRTMGMRFVSIKAGAFTRGEGETAPEVTLTQSFELGQFEVTQKQK